MKPVISRFGYIHDGGVGSHATALTWEQLGCPGKTLRWKLFSDQPFTNFGRMDLLTKHMMLAVEMMGVNWQEQVDSKSTGIIIGTRYGCITTDALFCQSANSGNRPSPLLFPYTLPSTPLGEITIRYQLKGPGFCYIAGRDSYKSAFWEAVDLVQSGQANACLCVVGDAISSDANYLAGPEKILPADSKNVAFAWLIQNPQNRNNAVGLPIAQVRTDNAQPDSGLFPDKNEDIMPALAEFLRNNNIEGEKLFISSPECLASEKTMTITRLKESDFYGRFS